MVLEIWEKILDFGIFSEILNFLKFFLKIVSYNFQSRKQILTLRGVYFSEILSFFENFENYEL